MSIQVRYFAALRERLGRESDSLADADGLTVADIWSRATDGEALPSNVLCAVNMEYVEPAASVQDGDEVAFFPPVTGG